MAKSISAEVKNTSNKAGIGGDLVKSKLRSSKGKIIVDVSAKSVTQPATIPRNQGSVRGKKCNKLKRENHVGKKVEKKWPSAYRSNIFGVVRLMSELKLREAHLKLLKKTPFWYILQALRTIKLTEEECKKKDKVAMDIIDTYDEVSKCFRLGGYKVNISDNDIRIIFGTSCGTQPMRLKYGNKNQSSLVARRSLQDTRLTMPVIRDLLDKYLEGNNQDDVEDVVRLICIYLCYTLFLSTSGTTIKWVHLIHIEDLDRMRDYDWCGAIRNTLMTSVHKNHEEPKHIFGCVIALFYWLCEHTNIVTSERPQAFPRCLKWNLKKLHEVVKNLSLQSLSRTQVWPLEL